MININIEREYIPYLVASMTTYDKILHHFAKFPHGGVFHYEKELDVCGALVYPHHIMFAREEASEGLGAAIKSYPYRSRFQRYCAEKLIHNHSEFFTKRSILRNSGEFLEKLLELRAVDIDFPHQLHGQIGRSFPFLNIDVGRGELEQMVGVENPEVWSDESEERWIKRYNEYKIFEERNLKTRLREVETEYLNLLEQVKQLRKKDRENND